MRKRLVVLLAVSGLVMLFGFGCEQPSESIEPPTNLTLHGATNETDLVLTWSPSPTEDIDGYIIYFNGVELAEVDASTTTYTHTAPDELGTYEVVAYRGDEESSAATASTELVEGTGELYDLDTPTDVGYSGWGWNWDTGAGASYSVNENNADYIDFYYDSDNTLTSADVLDWSDFTTGFQVIAADYDNVGNLPTEGYVNYVDVGEGQVYGIVVFKNHTDEWHYVKLRIDSYTSSPHDRITFTYGYQTVPNFSLMD